MSWWCIFKLSGICDRCVHRFDHHCIWTNKDVGGLNHGSFVLFLLSHIAIMVNGVRMASRSLYLYTQHYKLMQTSVMAPDGSMQSITLTVLFQVSFYLRRIESLCPALFQVRGCDKGFIIKGITITVSLSPPGQGLVRKKLYLKGSKLCQVTLIPYRLNCSFLNPF